MDTWPIEFFANGELQNWGRLTDKQIKEISIKINLECLKNKNGKEK